MTAKRILLVIKAGGVAVELEKKTPESRAHELRTQLASIEGLERSDDLAS